MTARAYIVTRYATRFTFEVDDELMESHYRRGEICEHHMLDWIERNIPRGGLWVDAGANIGNHVLPFSLWADRVVAFEPMPVNFALLARNIAGFHAGQKIEAVMMGVSDEAMSCSAKLGGTGKNCQWEMQTGEPGDILLTTIDDAVGPMANVRLIKLDVEGMEQKALRGAMRIIGRCKPELFVEIWDAGVLADIRMMLAPLGYVLIERWNVAPTYHFSASGRYPVTYTPPA